MAEHLTPIEQANWIAARAVSYAAAYLRGEHDAVRLADNANQVFLDMLVVENSETSRFLVPVQLLAITMMQTARYGLSDERRDRWQGVMGSLVELVQHESRKLLKEPA